MRALFTRQKALAERADALITQERTLLADLAAALERFGVDVAPADRKTLDETIAGIAELFLLVVAGEFNSGKSSFINTLVGETVMAEGVTPTTDRITVLRYGDEPAEKRTSAYLAERRQPAELLRNIAIVDTPGANAVIRQHEELTREFIPRADLVLFVTSADRPFTESERSFLELIRDWGKKVVIVINKADLLEPAEVDQVVAFVAEHAHTLFGFTPEIFPLSARGARRARAADDAAAFEASRFGAIEQYIAETLDAGERVRLKLLSPLGVAQRITDKYLTVVEDRLGTLTEDVAAIDNIDRQLDLFRDDVSQDFRYHRTEIDNLLNEFELRGIRFFDDTIRINNLPRLIRESDSVRAEFEDAVVADLPQQIDMRTQRLIDWIIDRNLKLWQSTTDHLRRERLSSRPAGMIGDIGGSFDYNRSQLIESVANQVGRVVDTYDREKESAAMAEEVRTAIGQTALVGTGAVGVGALLVVLAHTALLDVTGILAAGTAALAGLYLIPNKRRDLKHKLRERVAELRIQIIGTMQRQFDGELELMVQRVREAIAPYTRFIRAQREQLTELQGTFSDVDVAIATVRGEIERG